MQTYIVTRHHVGDRVYAPGDERTAVASEVAHLVANGVLVAKAERPVPNKAEKAAPKNKAAR